MHDSSSSSLEERFELRRESFRDGELVLELALPRSSEDLIDEALFDLDERLPYWAELWPAARALTRELLSRSSLPPRAIELGCGVGLPSLALLARGVDVLATDYYEDALLFARYNAAANRLSPLRTLLLDWRSPPRGIGRFPLVVAADVLYEARNADTLLTLLPLLLEPEGRVLIADPGRVHHPGFLSRMIAGGWSVTERADRLEAAPGGEGRHTKVRLTWLRRDVAA